MARQECLASFGGDDVTVMVSELDGTATSALPVEIVERKGIGHPDTICDALAEEVSLALSRFYLQRLGFILHHNVDKVLLRGGAAQSAFAGGEVKEPIEVYLSGRAAREYRGVSIPVDQLAIDACQSWPSANLHALDAKQHVRVHCLVRPGSADLVELFERQRQKGGALLANDTSIGVGYAPLTPLESAVIVQAAASAGCGLIVTGVARFNHVGDYFIGTAVDHVIRHATAPVLVVKQRPHGPYSSILVATDYSSCSRQARLTAAALFPDAALHLIHAYHVPYEGWLRSDEVKQEVTREAQVELGAFVQDPAIPDTVRARISARLGYGKPHTVVWGRRGEPRRFRYARPQRIHSRSHRQHGGRTAAVCSPRYPHGARVAVTPCPHLGVYGAAPPLLQRRVLQRAKDLR